MTILLLCLFETKLLPELTWNSLCSRQSCYIVGVSGVAFILFNLILNYVSGIFLTLCFCIVIPTMKLSISSWKQCKVLGLDYLLKYIFIHVILY